MAEAVAIPTIDDSAIDQQHVMASLEMLKEGNTCMLELYTAA